MDSMSEREQYNNFYRMLRKGHKHAALRKQAIKQGAVVTFDNALMSFMWRNGVKKPSLQSRLAYYKLRKEMNSIMGEAA